VRPFPEPIGQWSRLAFLPFLAALDRIEADDRRALLKAMQSVSQESSIWRISLLRNLHFSEEELQAITQPTLLIAGERDCLFHSVSEAERLAAHIPNANIHLLPHSGHACLLEADVNLFDIMATHGFVPNVTPAAKASDNENRTNAEMSRKESDIERNEAMRGAMPTAQECS
jgi:pimeloyl-ACP methyl ester carboxylesterase